MNTNTLHAKKIFNQDSKEDYMEAKIIGGNPNGIINYNRTPHKHAVTLYKQSCARVWFPEQVNVSKDKVNYSKLSQEEKRAYDLVLAQLITNDSIQSNQLVDGINKYITSPVVNALLCRQAMEECLIEGTKVLTKKGFIDFRYLTEEDEVANWHEDKSITYAKPKRIIKRQHEGTMYRFHKEGYEQVVTPEHNLVIIVNKRDVEKRLAKYNLNYGEALPIIKLIDGEYVTRQLSSKDIVRESIEYNGNVYCCEVDSGMIICSYNDTMFVTGNCNHSQSYSVMAEDIAQDTDRIFNMHNVDEELHLKNKAVEKMYEQLYISDKETFTEPTKEDILMVFVANQILEELVFPCGFVTLFSMETKTPGTSEMLKEILI